MKGAYDLHIHSCLSPCASDDMTPANIAAMAHLNALSIISLTDHNTGGNLTAMQKEADNNNLIFIPGIEVTSKEEVHILAYFSDLDKAINFGSLTYSALPDIKNRPGIFGNQIVMNDKDEKEGVLDKLLLQATPYSLDELEKMIRAREGCAVPAHINRESFSLLSNIGYIPPVYKCVEIVKFLCCQPIDNNLKLLYSSDAHNLKSLAGASCYLPDIHNAKDFISYLKS